jgi:hypothetical protein
VIPAGVQVFVALGHVDMRCGVERLSGLVRERMGYEPRGGALFVFVGRRQASKNLAEVTSVKAGRIGEADSSRRDGEGEAVEEFVARA